MSRGYKFLRKNGRDKFAKTSVTQAWCIMGSLSWSHAENDWRELKKMKLVVNELKSN